MIRLGTRRSPLALAQATTVADALRRAGHDVRIVEVVTLGDRDRAAPDKAKWVSELERALLAGDVDVAVHSAKDVPGELPDGLALVAAGVREDPRDVLIGVTDLDALPDGATVGTASLRRAAQLLAARRDLRIVEIRGNVDTRLGRLRPAAPRRVTSGADGSPDAPAAPRPGSPSDAAREPVDAIVLAAAGLRRLGRAPGAMVHLAGGTFVPAPGQGIVTLEARADDRATIDAVRAIHDERSWTALRAERALARALGADCTSAVGAHATVDGGTVRLSGFVGAPDGSGWAIDRREGDDPEALGQELAARLRRAGADELLDAARRTADPARRAAAAADATASAVDGPRDDGRADDAARPPDDARPDEAPRS
ncbi:MAG: hydroxymethylbilane synthase [Solirubrobacteraceae bacterium]|nr:hydroxymethylbilane synthase [Solirubrobacteraceae bacterium]